MRNRLKSLILPASLGLNLALAGVFAYQAIVSDQGERGRRSSDWNRGRSSWTDDRDRRSMPDSLRTVPRMDREQIERLRNMRTEMMEETQPMRDRVRELQSLMRTELREESPSLAYLDSLTTESMQLQRSIQMRSLRLILEEREILTPEQYRLFLRYMVPGNLDFQDSRSRDSNERDYSGRRTGGDPPDGRPPNRPPPDHPPPGRVHRPL
jgi:hypothetical protein